MPGKRLNSCCQDLVYQSLQYAESEKENRSPIIPINACHDKFQRVAASMGISRGTVLNIKRRKESTTHPLPSTSRPLYKQRLMYKTLDVPDRTKMDIRKLIYEMYKEKRHVTLKSLCELLKERGILELSISSLQRLLKHLGFKFRVENNRRALMEKNNIAALRYCFLRKYQANLTSSFKREIVFLDETWIFSKGNRTKSWQDEDIRSVRKPEGYDGKRFIVLHAGNRKGFISNASLVFSSKANTADYHGEMNHTLFKKWIETQLIPNLEEPSIIVMDNAPYHSVLLEKAPAQDWNKAAIIKWLEDNQIPFENTMNKSELLEITKCYKREKTYVIDELLRSYGHDVMRLPPYHCDFNAIELIWAQAKTYYNKHIGRDGSRDEAVISMWQEALSTCTADVWIKCIDHTEKLIEEWYEREANAEEFILTVNCGSENDDSEEDTD